MIRGGLLFTVVIASLTTFASACSSSSSSSAGGSCSAYVAALRDGAKQCGRFNVSPGREATYLARLEQSCQSALAAPGSGISPAMLDQCTARIREQCGDDDACEDIFDDARGTLPDGTACSVDYQCASGQCKKSIQDSASTCGKCAPAVAIGEPCPDGGCVAGATCRSTSTGTGSGSTTSSVCVAVRIANQGDPCGSTSPSDDVVRCASGLYCKYGSAGSSGTCEEPVGEGAACGQAAGYAQCKAPFTCVNDTCGSLQQAGGECKESNDCASGLGCDSASGKCTAISWVANGAECDDTLKRCDQGFCARSSTSGSGGSGTCKAYIADGQPCDVKSSEERCDSLSRCIDGTCQLEDPAQCK